MPGNNNWSERLTAIPCIHQAGLTGWQDIEHSGSNQLLKITTGDGHWLVRLNQPLPGVDRHYEQRLLQQLQTYPWVPRLIDCDPQAGYLITEFIDQPTWQSSDYADRQKLSTLAEQLHSLHQLPCDQPHTRLDQRLHTYLATVPVAADVARRIRQHISLLEQSQFWDACRWMYHSDLNPGNLLGTDPVYLIDWEFAGQGHGILDWLIMEHESGQDLSAWYPADTQSQWLQPLRQLIADLMTLWQPLMGQ